MTDFTEDAEEIENRLFLLCPPVNQTEKNTLRCNRSRSEDQEKESLCKKELLELLANFRDKLFFVLFHLDGPEKEPTSFLVQADPHRLPELEDEVDDPNALHCTFFLEHPNDINKEETKKRFWLRWQKYNPKTDTLCKKLTLYSPGQKKKALKRSCLPWGEWLDLTDSAVCIHGPFDFGSNSKNLPTYCIRKKDWAKLPSRILSSQFLEKERINRKKMKFTDDKAGVYIGNRLFLFNKFYSKARSHADGKSLYFLTDVKKQSDKEYYGICTKHIPMKTINNLYVKVDSSHISIPLVELHEAKECFCRADNISPYTYCPPERNKAFHFAYYFDQTITNVNSSMNHSPKILDLFCGAGGMSAGFALAGVETSWAIDKDQFSSATYKASAHGRSTKVYCEDISCFFKNVRSDRPGYPRRGEVDHIHASPPCQGFSSENRFGGSDDKANKDLSYSFTESIELFRPKTATMENVLGMLQTQHSSYIDKIVPTLLSMEYQVRCVVLNAMNYGDPQSRRRFIIFAARKDCELPKVPQVTHGTGTLRPCNTVDSAIGFLSSFPPDCDDGGGGSFQMDDGTAIFNHKESTRKPAVEDRRLVGNKPAGTITCNNFQRVHHTANRYLTVREAACLQSFAVNYQFFGSQGSMYRQIGNAVPVKLARAIAWSVLASHEV